MAMKLLLQREQMKTRTYHIYLNDKVLFKDLNEEEFDIIWGRIYRSYYNEELTYTEILENPHEEYIEASY